MTTTPFAVSGMTCQHCVTSVTNEVMSVNGVDSVAVDLDRGLVSVTGTDVATPEVIAAIAEAGYEARPA